MWARNSRQIFILDVKHKVKCCLENAKIEKFILRVLYLVIVKRKNKLVLFSIFSELPHRIQNDDKSVASLACPFLHLPLAHSAFIRIPLLDTYLPPDLSGSGDFAL